MRSIIRFLLLSWAMVAIGCGSAVEPEVVEAPVPATAAAAPAPEPVKPVPTPAAAEATAKPAPAPAVAFNPPFPDRLDLFEPPKRAQNAVKRDDEHGETVELKGFVHVDEPRVVLSIDGVISPVPEGGEKYGVQVISIQPPSVVLQRGRNRWTATLE